MITDDFEKWLAPTGVLGSIFFAVRWWYAARRLKNADYSDTQVANSVGWMLEHLKKMIEAQSAEIQVLRTQNQAQGAEIARLNRVVEERAYGSH